jgi:hypothetical protein
MKLHGGTAMHKFELKEIKVLETLDTKWRNHSYKDAPGLSGVFGFFWYKHGSSHREDNKPSDVYFDGTMRWYIKKIFIKEEHTDYLFPSNEITWDDGNVNI